METQLLKQSLTLYEIRADHLQLLSMIEDAEGEMTPEIEQALALNETDFQAKAISYAYVCKGFEDTEEVIDREIKRLIILKDMAEKRRELFKQTLSNAMQEYGIEKIETPTLKLSFRKSEAVNITDETKIAAKFLDQKITYVISKTKIKEAIKEGHSVSGAELITKNNLQIK